MFSTLSSSLLPLWVLTNAVPNVSAYRWFNWEFDITCESTDYIVPADEAELAAFLKKEHDRGSFIKAVGNGHCLSNLTTCVDTTTTGRDSYIVSLINLHNITYGDNNMVTFGGGWDLIDLIPNLIEHKLQPSNLCSERVQNFIGAATTGTHGTGQSLGNLASTIIAFRVLDAAGNVHVINETSNPDAVNAYRIGLGALGIITEVTIQAAPLQFVKRTTEVVQSTSNVTEQISQTARYAEKRGRVNINGPNYSWNSSAEDWGLAHHLHHHTEQLKGLNNEAASYIFRLIQGDDAFLSPVNKYNLGSENSGVFVAMTLTYTPSYNDYESLWAYTDALHNFSTISLEHNARPHWNKNSQFDLSYAEEVYPHVDKWLKVQKQNDPKCQFANKFLVEHFNLTRCKSIVPTAVPGILI